MSDPISSGSRRKFIANAGLAAAAISMPQIVRGQESSGKKLRVGIIGSGGRSDVVGEMALRDGRY